MGTEYGRLWRVEARPFQEAGSGERPVTTTRPAHHLQVDESVVSLLADLIVRSRVE
jgi:hypothetical protein